MITTRLAVFFSITISLILGIPTLSSADIYRYQDKNGVWHFTNIKTDRRYRLYIRSYRKKSSEFIKEYEWMIKQAAGRFGVDSSLIKAVIKAESAFDHKAVSRKGAKGLMQLMPQTSSDMKVENPFNPEENIFGGTRYLSLLLDRFENNKMLALAAYNAGPETVETHQGIPPFPETKSFVRKVLDYYKQYKSGNM